MSLTETKKAARKGDKTMESAMSIWNAYTDYQTPDEFLRYSKARQRVDRCVDAYARWAAREQFHQERGEPGARKLSDIRDEVYGGMSNYLESLGIEMFWTCQNAARFLEKQ